MKRIIAICICLILVLTASIGLCDDNSGIPFQCMITTIAAPESAIEIIVSDAQRALLTVCLAIDLGIAGDEEGKAFVSEHIGEYLMHDSYVVSDGKMLIVSGYAAGKILNMCYDPVGKEARYTLTDSDLPDALTATVVKQTAETQTLNYKNDVATLLKVLEVMKEAITGD